MLPKLLKNAITEFDYASGGENLFATAWKVPAVVSDELRKQAISHANSLIPALRVVESSRLREWLVMLGTLSAGQISVADARLKSAAYAEMLSGYPAGVFTKETLAEIAKKSKWLPSFSEIAEVLDKKDSELKTINDRCGKIASARNEEKKRRGMDATN